MEYTLKQRHIVASLLASAVMFTALLLLGALAMAGATAAAGARACAAGDAACGGQSVLRAGASATSGAFSVVLAGLGDRTADDGLPATITLAVASLATVGSGVAVTASVVDAAGKPVTDGLEVRFDVSSGRVELPHGSTTAGEVRTTWSVTTAGTAAIVASVDGLQVERTVRWAPGVPAVVELIAPLQAPVEATATVQALVLDAWRNRVKDGIQVTFVGNGGRFEPAIVGTVDGNARTTWHGGSLPGDVRVRATVGAEDGPSDERTMRLLPADLRLSMTLLGPAGPLPDTQLHPGELLQWSLDVRNAGAARARDVELRAILPEAFAIQSVTATGEVVPLAFGTGPPEPRRTSQTEVGWQLPDLDAGVGLTLTMILRPEKDEPWTGMDLFFLRGAVTTTTAEATPEDMQRTAQVRVFSADLHASQRFDPINSSLRPGGQIIYDLNFGNAQLQTDVNGAVLTNLLPESTRFDHWQPHHGTTITPTHEFSPEDRQLSWDVLGPVPGSGGLRLWLTIDDAAPPESSLRNRFAIDSPVHDIRPENNVTPDDGVWLPGVNLNLVVEGPLEAEAGALVSLTAKLRNDARRDTARDVSVDAVMPPGVLIEAVAAPGLPVAGDRVRWLFEVLPPGAEQELRLTARLPADAPLGETFRFVFDAKSSLSDSDSSSNRASLTATIVPGGPSAMELTTDSRRLDVCASAEARLQATVHDDVGQPVADGTVVRWSTTAGMLVAGDASPSASLSTTTSGGSTTVRLRAARLPASASVRAATADVEEDLTVELEPGRPAALLLSVTPQVVQPSGTSRVSLGVLDACGNAVGDGTAVELEAQRGRFASGSERVVVTTRSGHAAQDLNVGSVHGSLRVSAIFGPLRAEALLDVSEPATPVTQRWTIYLPVGQRQAHQAAGR